MFWKYVFRIVVLCGLVLGFAYTVTRTRREVTRLAIPDSTPTVQPAAAVPQASFSPRQLAFQKALVSRLKVPAGFRINVFAEGVTNARMIAVAPNGTVYVTQPGPGEVTALRDDDGDGAAETRRTVATGLNGVHGIALRANILYLATRTSIYTVTVQPDGTVGKPNEIVDDLPSGGGHVLRTMAFGPDGMLYISIGSTSNDTPEADPENAAILRMRAAGNGRKVYARGLRNTEAFAWHPKTREMWGMDIGSDRRGPDLPPEELNHLKEGGDYGWPWCYGKRVVDAMTAGQPAGMTKEAYSARTEPMVLGYQAHSSPIQLAFYTGKQFPAEYHSDAFVTLHGSWNRQPPVGYTVVRIRYDAAGRPTGFEDFLTGFLTEDGAARFGRPAGLAQLPDGSLLVGDDSNGVIYRVTYRGNR
ncbi:MAG: PQQ-dependent sugar dehydrogenase [Armatimonadota bacterium]